MIASLVSSNKFYDSSYILKSNSTQNAIAVKSDTTMTASKNCSTGSIDNMDEDDFFKFCTQTGQKSADTLEGYKKLRQENSDTTSMTEDDYENEFQDYIRFRGCQTSAELRELDSAKNTYYATKGDLIKFAKSSVSELEKDMKDCDCPLLSDMKDWESVFDSADTSDLVNFAQNFVKTSSKESENATFGQKVTGLVTFLSKSLTNTNLSLNIKQYLMSYLKKINSKMADITNYSVYLKKKEKAEEEAAAKKATENSINNDVTKNTAFETSSTVLQQDKSSDCSNQNSDQADETKNLKKYKENLISQYKS